MRESKSARFCRLAEARVNKIIKMIRLLGNCSGKAVYQYDSEQVEEIFAAIQFELDAARRRFYTEKTPVFVIEDLRSASGYTGQSPYFSDIAG